jgi:hypothetical protein
MEDARPGPLEVSASAVIHTVNAWYHNPEITDLQDAVSAWQLLCEAAQTLAWLRDDLADAIAQSMPAKHLTVSGVTVEKHVKPPRRTEWDHDSLLRLVVDSRAVDKETGEIESALEILKRVYPLKGYNARITELKKLSIDPDEFCHTEWTDRMTLREFK